MNKKNSDELSAIQDRFAEEWLDGKQPTLEGYLELYPTYRQELIEYVVTFAELFAVEAEQDDCDTRLARDAMERGLSAGMKASKGLSERLTEIGHEKDSLARSIHMPFEAFGQFNRHRIMSVPWIFWTTIANEARLTVAQVQRMLSPSTRLSYRSQGKIEIEEITFAELLERLRSAGQISAEDHAWWLARVEGA